MKDLPGDEADVRPQEGGELGTKKDWGVMLDQLCRCIAPQDEAHMRGMAAGLGIPSHLVPLHDHVARLLVKYGITTCFLLRTRFPGELQHFAFH
jgi:hypothetical protein